MADHFEDTPFEGEVQTPATPPEPTPETEPETPAEEPVSPFAPLTSPTYELAIDPSVPAHELPGDYADQVEGFARVAAESGLPAGTAQRLLDTFVDESVLTRYERPLTGMGAMDDALVYLRSQWRQDFDANMRHVRVAVAKLGTGFAKYLDESGLGNHPAALNALAAYGRGDLSLSKADAQKRLAAIMHSKDYLAPKSEAESRKQTAIVRNLYKIANSDAYDAAPARDPFSAMKARGAGALVTTRDFGRVGAAAARAAGVTVPDGAMSAVPAIDPAAARKELSAMMSEKNGPLMNANAPGHKAAVERFHKLVAVLKP